MTFEEFALLVRTRRTQLVMDQERDVEMALVQQLCEAASFAPNHQQTWPWLFGVFTGEGRRGLGSVTADAMQRNGDSEIKVAKTRTKYLRSPVLLVAGTAPGETELQTVENRDAVAAGIQTLLLGATVMDLGSFWSSCPKGANDDVARHCGWPAGTHVTAMIYLGWPTRTLPDRERPAPAISYFVQ
jgi:nitroreductase